VTLLRALVHFSPCTELSQLDVSLLAGVRLFISLLLQLEQEMANPANNLNASSTYEDLMNVLRQPTTRSVSLCTCKGLGCCAALIPGADSLS
jgi:hypothetical protein